jgi:hypothetical protein
MAAPLAAYLSTVKINVAAATTVMTNEACSLFSGSNPNAVYRITSAAHQIIDPNTAVVVKDNGVTLTPGTQYTLDYLFGFIKFVSYTPTTPITINGAWITTTPVQVAKKVSLEGKQDTSDITSFDSGGIRKRLGTIVGYSGSFDILENLQNVLDGASMTLASVLANGSLKMIEVSFGGTGRWRAWVLLDSGKVDAAVAGVVEGSVNFNSVTQGQGFVAAALALPSFSWGP